MIWLLLFHILFFYKLYNNPFQLATSELLSTFFPSWRWQGSMWANRKVPRYDPYYWLNSHAHPVLSTYYPIHGLSALLSHKLGLDNAFKVYVYQLLAHYLFASIGWMLFLQAHFSPGVSLFGAITFTYQAYHLKQQGCVVYTLSWFPWVLWSLSHITLLPIAVAMVLLAGYYPLAVYLLPMAFLASPTWQTGIAMAVGFLLASPQLIPFIKYLPKTIRKAKSAELSCPSWERNFYLGLIPIILLMINPQWRYLWLLTPIIGSSLLRNFLPRIHQRAWILSSYLTIYFALSVLNPELVSYLILIQCLDLYIHNSSLIPTRPYCELYQKPSLSSKSRLIMYLKKNLGSSRVSGLPWPHFTGQLHGLRTLGYSGGMQLKLMAKWRNDTDPNGGGKHDGSYLTDDQLTRSRVEFSYTRKKSNWLSTEILHLYRNPRLS